jgi:hypothetical protein
MGMAGLIRVLTMLVLSLIFVGPNPQPIRVRHHFEEMSIRSDQCSPENTYTGQEALCRHAGSCP